MSDLTRAFWEFKLKPWDVSAGGLIAREAGAKVTVIDGREDFLYHCQFWQRRRGFMMG